MWKRFLRHPLYSLDICMHFLVPSFCWKIISRNHHYSSYTWKLYVCSVLVIIEQQNLKITLASLKRFFLVVVLYCLCFIVEDHMSCNIFNLGSNIMTNNQYCQCTIYNELLGTFIRNDSLQSSLQIHYHNLSPPNWTVNHLHDHFNKDDPPNHWENYIPVARKLLWTRLAFSWMMQTTCLIQLTLVT